MPEGEVTFELMAPIEKVWNFLSDMEKVASCLPALEEVKVIDKGVTEWTIKIKVGPLAKTVKLRTEATKLLPPTHAEFRGEGENISLVGKVDLRPISPDTTEVSYRMSANATGSLGPVINNILKGRVQKDVEEFKKNVKKRIEYA